MEFAILIVLLILIGVTIYYLYATLLNRKLNRKKQYFGENEIKNVYANRLKVFTSSTTMVILFFVLYIAFSNPLRVVNNFSSEEKYQQIMNHMVFESDDKNLFLYAREAIDRIKIEEKYVILEEQDKIYALDDNKLIVMGLSGDREYLECDYPTTNNLKTNIITTSEKIIVYRIFYEEQNLKSEICIYHQQDLSLCEKIILNGAIKQALIRHGFLKMFMEQEVLVSNQRKDLTSINYTVRNKTEKTLLKNAYYFDGGLIKKALTIVKIDLDTYKTKMQTIYLADHFLVINENKAYIISNIPSRNTIFPKSIILAYDLKKMEIVVEKVFGGAVYEKPLINENDELLLNVVRETAEKNQYITFVLNNKLEIINSNIVELNKEVYLGTAENFYYTAVENDETISFGTLNEYESEALLVNLESNHLQIDKIINGKLIQVTASNNKLYLLNYSFNFAAQNTEIFVCDKPVVNLRIANYYVQDNHLRVIYETDNTIGYLKISLVDNRVDKEYSIEKTNEKVMFTDHYAIKIQEKTLQIIDEENNLVFTFSR